jgi:hypothetical protein
MIDVAKERIVEAFRSVWRSRRRDPSPMSAVGGAKGHPASLLSTFMSEGSGDLLGTLGLAARVGSQPGHAHMPFEHISPRYLSIAFDHVELISGGEAGTERLHGGLLDMLIC